MKTRLSTLWIFASLNYLYCDVVSLMDSKMLKGYLAGSVGGLNINPGFLLAAGVLVEIPMSMVLLSRLLADRPNRWANIVAGAIMTVVQAGTLFVGTTTPYYLFFSFIEIATTAAIVWQAWSWASKAGDEWEGATARQPVGGLS